MPKNTLRAYLGHVSEQLASLSTQYLREALRKHSLDDDADCREIPKPEKP